jgi:FkbM family methyltransferase
VDNADYRPRLLPLVLESGLLADDPFVLIDVGCGQGPDPLWRQFGDAFVMHGFDPNIEEIERLAAEEESPNVHYHASLVGLPDDHEFHERWRRDRREASGYFEPWLRTSAAVALERVWEEGNRSLAESNAWNQHELTRAKTSVDDFVRAAGIVDVDFVKTDTDGHDLEVLLSAERTLRETGVLGLLVEATFTGAYFETANTLPNVDRYLRRLGFPLFSMTVNRYSRAALPAPFEHRGYAQTTSGQALWGDLLFLRDGGAPEYPEFWGEELSLPKTLKLACLYELFRLPDCAAELLVRRRELLEDRFDVERALDVLTPPLDGVPTSYVDYRAAFEADPARFFPPEQAQEPVEFAVQPAVVRRPPRELLLQGATTAWSATPEPVRRMLRPLVRALSG